MSWVASKGVEDGDATPFRALVKSDEELAKDCGRDVEDAWVRGGCRRLGTNSVVDVGEGCNGVGNDLRVLASVGCYERKKRDMIWVTQKYSTNSTIGLE